MNKIPSPLLANTPTNKNPINHCSKQFFGELGIVSTRQFPFTFTFWERRVRIVLLPSPWSMLPCPETNPSHPYTFIAGVADALFARPSRRFPQSVRDPSWGFYISPATPEPGGGNGDPPPPAVLLPNHPQPRRLPEYPVLNPPATGARVVSPTPPPPPPLPLLRCRWPPLPLVWIRISTKWFRGCSCWLREQRFSVVLGKICLSDFKSLKTCRLLNDKRWHFSTTEINARTHDIGQMLHT